MSRAVNPPRHFSDIVRFILVIVLLASCVTAHAQRPAGDSTIAERRCRLCHADKFAGFEQNAHSILNDTGWQERTGNPIACVNCHGDVAEHMRLGGGRQAVFAFREESPLAQADRCNGCHRDTHPGFDRSPHATAGLSCTSCHSQHGAAPQAHALLKSTALPLEVGALRPTSSICFDCHGDIFSQFAFNERHRLREGVLDCTSCHDPHAPATRADLGGFKQEACIDCHTDKGGPFVFEHPASRTEGCTACHSPHGSPNRHLLSHERVAELCLTCHAAVPQFHLGFSPVGPPRFGLDTQCTTCHSSIHGSNFDPKLLR